MARARAPSRKLSTAKSAGCTWCAPRAEEGWTAVSQADEKAGRSGKVREKKRRKGRKGEGT
eukprot:3379917-Pleurochrysis_carterae.AAC.1